MIHDYDKIVDWNQKSKRLVTWQQFLLLYTLRGGSYFCYAHFAIVCVPHTMTICLSLAPSICGPLSTCSFSPVSPHELEFRNWNMHSSCPYSTRNILTVPIGIRTNRKKLQWLWNYNVGCIFDIQFKCLINRTFTVGIIILINWRVQQSSID